MIKFNQDAFENFGYTFHAPKFQTPFVRENGIYVFSTVKDGIKVEVQLSTGNNYCMGDYDFPDPDYSVASISYDDQKVSLDYVEEDDFELYEAICDIVSSLDSYSQSTDDYTFNCEGYQEMNFNHAITMEYNEINFSEYQVISCNLK